MIERLIKPELTKLLSAYPAAAIVGPRQCGKTTLAKSFSASYFDLELPAERTRLDLLFPTLDSLPAPIILDEAQAAPELFPRLRGSIDADRKRTGRFLLLGSVSPALMTSVAESLAGRLGLLELTPFLTPELPPANLDHLWLCGGFPDGGVLTPAAFPRWQADYLALLTQRDLPTWGLPAAPATTQRLLQMLAAVNGQSWNASQLAASLSLDYKTVNKYTDFLAGAFLVRKLQPYHANLSKRLVKSPKLYLRDTGLLHSLLRTATFEQLLAQPWVGASWEGFVIEQILSTLTASGIPHQAHYFRSSDGQEIDLVLDIGPRRYAIEIKLTTSPSPADLFSLSRKADLIAATHRILLTRNASVTPFQPTQPATALYNLPAFLAHVAKAPSQPPA